MNLESMLAKVRQRMTKILIATLIVTVLPIPMYAGDYTDSLFLRYDGQVYKYQNKLVDIEIDGEEIDTGDMPAVLINNATMVPVREVLESDPIDATVEWNSDEQQIYVTYKDKFIVLQIDSTTAYINDEEVSLSAPAKLVQDVNNANTKTMIPLRFISESLGFEVDWNQDTFTANIITNLTENTSDDADDSTDTDESADTDDSTDTDESTDTEGSTDTSEETDTSSDQDSSESQSDENDSSDTDEIYEEGDQGEDTETDSTDTSDTTDDATSSDDERLESLGSDEASQELPTELKDNPISFEAEDTSDEDSTTSEITAEDYPLAHVQDVEFDEDTSTFTINVDGQVSDLTTQMLDGRFLIKVKNADFDRSTMEIDYKENEILDAIRMGLHEEESPTQAWIVLDILDLTYNFEVSLNDDRNEIIIHAVQSEPTSITLGQNDEGDYVRIEGVNAAAIEAFRLSNPSRIVFDVANTVSPFGYQEEEDTKGQYVTAIRTSQFDDSTMRIVLETDGQPDYEIEEADDGSNAAIIQLKEPGYSNINYDNSDDTPTITLGDDDDSTSFPFDDITYDNDYWDRKYTITIPGDYSDYFGEDTMKVNDGIVDSIDVSLNDDGDTEIVIQTSVIREFRVEESDSGLVIKAYKPSDLYSEVIVVDAGHGGKDPGAVVGDYHEADVTLAVVQKLKPLLDTTDIKVYYTRLDDTYPTLQERCDIANEVGADFFLSIHCNSFTSSYQGTEGLYLPGTDTPDLNSFELADEIGQTFVDNTDFSDYTPKERTNLYVLNGTDMPATILEMGFLSNDYDRSLLIDDDYQEVMAQAIEKGILNVFEDYPTGREDQ